MEEHRVWRRANGSGARPEGGESRLDGPVRTVENGSLTVLSATDLTRALAVMRQHMPRAPR